jgi:NadR type nicotinamide-nucleotide adenylyltransferase
MSRRIAVIGPESTGKSTLCTELAEHYRSLWVPEYAREFLEKHGLQYTYDDLLVIAKEQVALEDRIAAKSSSPFLFIDTNLYVMKVWCEFVYGKCHQWILDEIPRRRYDLYLLCNIDLPWEYQEMREYPDLDSRARLFNMYKDILVNQPVPWTTISGNDQQRKHSAIAFIDSMLKVNTNYSSTF